MKSRPLKKLIAYGFLPFMVVFFAVSPLLGVNVVFAQGGCELQPGGFDALMCMGTLLSGATIMFNMILGLLLYLIGKILDFAIQFSILGEYVPPGEVATGTGGLYRSDTVNVAWNLLRDIINMSFIFILLYVAIGTVLNIQNINWKKQVSQIIIAAILVNFSLFLTRVVIDAGNIVANGFYQELTVCDPPCIDAKGNSRLQVNISERFMNALGIAQIDQLRTGEPIAGDQLGWTGYANGLMKTVVILIAMWVFLSVAILFIARTFALVFILVLSPIGVAGSSLPLLGGFAKKWREALFNYAMLGVVFLFFTFVILTFAVTERERITAIDIGIEGPNRNLIEAGLGEDDEGTSTESLFIMYALVIAGLIMSLRLTKNLSGQFGKFGDEFGKAALGIGLGVATGGASMATRAAVGGAASRTLANEELKAKAREGNRVAQLRLDAASWASKNSFDVRDSALGKVVSGKMKKAGFDISTTQKMGKGGYEAGMEKFEKSKVEKSKRYAPSIGPVENEARAEYKIKMKYAENMEKQALSMPEGDSMRERTLETVNELRKKAKENMDKTLAEYELYLVAEQEKFAESLTKDSWWKNARKAPVIGLTARNMDRRRERAAAAIRREINKKNFDILLEAVKDSAKQGAQKEEDNE
jgi:hypothetical protein